MQNVCQKAVTVKCIVPPREGEEKRKKKKEKKTLFDIKKRNGGDLRRSPNRDPLLVHETINYYVQSKL